MPASESILVLRARFVFPVVRPPIENGVVTLRDGLIEHVGTSCDAVPVDLGNVAILPGLVNAHTHLEFSDLEKPLGEPGEPLPTWIRRVIAYRREGKQSPEAAIQSGLAESHRAGVTAIGEIATSGWNKSNADASVTLFQEVICLQAERIDQVLVEERQRLNQRRGVFHCGISPHAPYTVHPQLVEKLALLAAEASIPLAMHLAESQEEIELLRTGLGPFRELLEELGAWREDAHPAGRRPLDYLKILISAPRVLVVHGNYLDDEEVAFLAERPDQFALVYCPRTHAFFGHEPYPLSNLLEKGITVCLGTDSRASNPNLNLFEEMKFVARHHSNVAPSEILRMGTVQGSRALYGAEAMPGLVPGTAANLSIIALPSGNASNPHDLLLDDASQVIGVWQHGIDQTVR
jgi:aminodeoxyfutalosine deaminase